MEGLENLIYVTIPELCYSSYAFGAYLLLKKNSRLLQEVQNFWLWQMIGYNLEGSTYTN